MMVDVRRGQVTLPMHMALEVASRWYELLLPCLDAELVEVDGGQVQDIDTPAFEALAALFIGRDHRRLVTRWRGLSPTLRQRIEALGLSCVLLLPAAS
ncbi:MAG: hypothetical protein JNM69_17400 [Archangium sp.]|nr:hypothetical protein [Archangium sp.]